MAPKLDRLLKKQKNNKKAKEEFAEESRNYYQDIQSKPKLYIDVGKILEKGSCVVSPENAIVLWIYEVYELEEWIELSLVHPANNSKSISSNSLENKNETSVQMELCSNFNTLQLDIDPKSNINGGIKYTSEMLFTEHLNNDNKHHHQQKLNPDTTKSSCKHPSVYITEKRLVICGLSSVLRFLLKFAVLQIEIQLKNTEEIDNSKYQLKKENLQKLLGFRSACLQACAEVSIWTKFCELDMIKTLKQTLDTLASSESTTLETNSDIIEEEIPKDLVRFELHLNTPVKCHNILKETQMKLKKIKSNDKLPEGNNVNKEICAELLDHDFAEGPHMLLSDLILFPCVYLLLHTYGEEVFQKNLPKTLTWCRKLDNLFRLSSSNKIQLESATLGHLENPCDIFFWNPNGTKSKSVVWKIPDIPENSLYKSDPARYNPKLRLFTRQYDIEEALAFCSSSGILPFEVGEVSLDLNWDEIPKIVHPEGGRLPKERQERKCQQLTSIAVEVMKIVEEKAKHRDSSLPMRIVDFCSGGGHLGILLAWLLPKCQVVLVENKEESLQRGITRCQQLGLSNVTMYQSNLDYFYGDFDIAVALHACGTATDLVFSKCIAANASFCITPCCYGSIQPNHMLHYPASRTYRESISVRNYLVLAHGSDQTHDESNKKTQQGKLCMRLIDTDRLMNLRERGYEQVYLKRMPETSSPKNHILVGISP